jgi:copper chaperone CopZ
MKPAIWLAAFAAALGVGVTAQAETKVTVSKTHLCCPACLSGVEEALADVKGVTHVSDQKAKTIEITADSDESAQAAIDALAAAGFYGTLDNDKLKYKDIKTPSGKVQRLELAGIHNCCGACTQAIKKAIKTVDGVKAETVKAKQTEFVVEGDFSATDLVKALLDAGFHVSVK